MALIKCLAQARIYRIDQESQCIQRIPVVRIFETSQERENGPPSLSQWSHQVQKDDHRNVVCTYFTGHNLRSQQYLQPLYANFFITMSIICFIYIYKEEKHRWGATSRALIVDHLVLWSHFNRLLAVFFCLFVFFLSFNHEFAISSKCLCYYFFVLLLFCTIIITPLHSLGCNSPHVVIASKAGPFLSFFFWDFF